MSSAAANKHLKRGSFAILAAAFALYLTALALAGAEPLGFIYYCAIAAFLLLPGYFLSQNLIFLFYKSVIFSLILPLGAAFLLLSFWMCGLLGVGAPFMLFPVLLINIVGTVRLLRRRSSVSPPKRRFVFTNAHTMLLLAFAGGLFVYTFLGVFPFAHAQAAGNMEYHQDMMWSVGNAASVAYGAPLRDLRAFGGMLNYHYLSDALPGFIALFSGLLPYDAVCFYHYPIVLAFLVISAFAAAVQYGVKTPAAALFPFLLLFCNGYRSGNTINLLLNMNGVATATALTCGLLALLFSIDRRPSPLRKGEVAAFSLCLFSLLMSKNLYGILVICALFAVFFFCLIFQRRTVKWALFLGAAGAGILLLCWLLVYRHAINNLIRTIWQGPFLLLKDLFLTIPLGALLWFATIPASFKKRRTLPVRQLFVNACAFGGILAYFIFHHYSSSHIYFLLAASLYIWLGAFDVLPLLGGKRRAKSAVLTFAIACFFCTVLSLAPAGRKGVQVVLRCMGLRPQYPETVQTVTPGDEAAALWLRRHMQPNEVFATNRNAKDPSVQEGTWHYYTAVSGRQAFVESWRYALDYGSDYHMVRHNLEQVSDVIFSLPDAQTAFSLARDNGINYLLVSKPLRSEPFAGAEPAFENSSAAIYTVPPA